MLHLMAAKTSIPLRAQWLLKQRLEKHVATERKNQCRSVVIRFRGAFAYVDAFPAKQDDPADATPIHLCRLRWLGSVDRWEFSFFKHSSEKYERSFTMSGSFVASPEEAFDTSTLFW